MPMFPPCPLSLSTYTPQKPQALINPSGFELSSASNNLGASNFAESSLSSGGPRSQEIPARKPPKWCW